MPGRRAWKALGNASGSGFRWRPRWKDKVLETGRKKVSRFAWKGNNNGEVTGTDLYVAVVRTTEKVLLKQSDASQGELERYLSTGAN